jgi:TPR repeat protein
MDVSQKSIAELVKAARDELHDGSTEGYLAFWRNETGDREVRLSRSDKLIALAESSLKPDDWDGALELWNAFKSGLGCRESSEAEKKAFHYISLLAEAGNTRAQEVLIADYLHGLNGLPLDKEKALHWCNRAAQNGSKFAAQVKNELV